MSVDVLPDCSMPDGADPCAGYRELRDRLAAADKILAEQSAALGRAHVDKLDYYRVREENKVFQDQLTRVYSLMKRWLAGSWYTGRYDVDETQLRNDTKSEIEKATR